jgi:uncharacterized protein
MLAFRFAMLYFTGINILHMKKLMILSALVFISKFSLAQQPDYRVVFDLSTRDSISQQALVREVELIRKYNPAAKVQVVVYGQGLPLVLKERSSQTEAIKRLIDDRNVEFKVCAFTLQRFKVDESHLFSGIKVVPDGIYEIISRQREGWGYIKVAH